MGYRLSHYIFLRKKVLYVLTRDEHIGCLRDEGTEPISEKEDQSSDGYGGTVLEKI